LAIVVTGCNAAGTATTQVTYVGVAGGAISIGVAGSPSGCNPNTVVGDTPTTRLLLAGVLPSPFTVNAAGAVTPNPNLILQSELVNTKPETIVYTLNPKARWSDGVAITAADFAYAWAQQRGDVTTPAGTVATIEGYRDISSVTGSNHGRTVTVIFRTPYADWQNLFANLLPAHVMEKVGWDPSCLSVDPAIDLSGGPFAVTAVSAQSVTLSANPKWWGVPANNHSITVHFASSTAQLAQWMRTGFTQLVLPTSVTPGFVAQMASLPNVETSVQASSTLLQLEMASGPDTHLSPDMRFAIAASLNRQAIVDAQADWLLPSIDVASSHLYVQGESGYKDVDATPLPIGAPTTSTSTSTTLIGQGGSVDFPTTPVPDQAAALMTASGYERTDGGPWHTDFGVPFSLHIVVDEGDPYAKATAPMVRDELEAAGFTVSLYPVKSATEAGTILGANFADMALMPRIATPYLSQGLAWYTLSLGLAGVNGSQDWSDFSNDQFTDLMTTAAQQLNPNTAAADYVQADQVLWDNMVALPLFSEPSVQVWSRTLGGVEQVPKSDSLLWYAQLWAVRQAETTNSTTPSLPGQ
jgi:peptide/nickel transport system substrate-binding protein